MTQKVEILNIAYNKQIISRFFLMTEAPG